eukprot:GAHX01000038.1.p1 GENE.GAHX01000038.1~~GAHX01000038.1.p1  ORF type:complete len:283 (-),score=44.97 GAHX01000038.1:45-893(-)
MLEKLKFVKGRTFTASANYWYLSDDEEIPLLLFMLREFYTTYYIAYMDYFFDLKFGGDRSPEYIPRPDAQVAFDNLSIRYVKSLQKMIDFDNSDVKQLSRSPLTQNKAYLEYFTWNALFVALWTVRLDNEFKPVFVDEELQHPNVEQRNTETETTIVKNDLLNGSVKKGNDPQTEIPVNVNPQKPLVQMKKKDSENGEVEDINVRPETELNDDDGEDGDEVNEEERKKYKEVVTSSFVAIKALLTDEEDGQGFTVMVDIVLDLLKSIYSIGTNKKYESEVFD